VLERLRAGGIAEVTLGGMPALVEECWERAEASGEARFAFLARAFEHVDRWSEEHDKYGGVPGDMVDQLDAIIRDRLPAALASRDALPAAELARDVHALLP
jgi:hypothetical protein